MYPSSNADFWVFNQGKIARNYLCGAFLGGGDGGISSGLLPLWATKRHNADQEESTTPEHNPGAQGEQAPRDHNRPQETTREHQKAPESTRKHKKAQESRARQGVSLGLPVVALVLC